MFRRIESQLVARQKTKVWFSAALEESTQNINNWKKRGVPAAKVKRIAEVLGVSREYLESGERIVEGVASPKADYSVSSNRKNQINYKIFIDISDKKVAKLLRNHLETVDDMDCLYCMDWSYVDPFIAVDIWLGEEVSSMRVLLRQDCIVGITDYA